MQETVIKPIETVYDGNRFRSRLEARWAVFFNTLGIEYEYEPEGFNLNNELMYLPDFRIKCYGNRVFNDKEPYDLYIEIKGKMTEEDARKIKLFSKSYPILVVGEIPYFQPESWMNYFFDKSCKSMGGDIYPYNFSTIDGDWYTAIPCVTDDHKFFLMGGDYTYERASIRNDDLLFLAYRKARQARFEHGEKPI